MKQVIKILSGIILFVMIVGCGFLECSTSNAADSSVSKDVLSVKCQIRDRSETDGQADLRIVTSIDDASRYSRAGFDIVFRYGEKDEKTIPYESKSAYKKIDPSGRVEYNYSPQVFDVTSEYFVSVTLVNISTEDFEKGILIKPYVKLKSDPNTKVYGRNRYVTVQEGIDGNIVSLPVDFAVQDQASLSITDSNGKTYSKEQILKVVNDGEYSHIRLLVETTELPSLTEFTITDGTNTNKILHRNCEKKLPQKDGSTYKGDQTWYELGGKEVDGKMRYAIVTAADLYGLSEIAAADTPVSELILKDKEFMLCADISVNDTTNYANWETTAPAILWTPIGNAAGRRFAGTFDGQGHSVSGLYNKKAWISGLFGVTGAGSYIKDIELLDSYFEGSGSVSNNLAYSWVGSIVGRARGGTFETIYSNATVKGTGKYAGGLIGVAQDSDVNVRNSWFAGTVGSHNYTAKTVNNQYAYAGGIIGGSECNTTITHCLNTGTVSGEDRMIGGILGMMSSGKTLTMEDTLNSGSVTSTLSHSYNRSVVGVLNNSDKTTLSNVYSMNIGTYGVIYAVPSGAATPAGADTCGTIEVADIKGTNAYLNTNLLFAEKETDGYWVTRDNNVPALESFVDEDDVASLAYTFKTDTSWLNDATGTENDPYIIHNGDDLYGLAELAKTEPFTGKFIQLADDIYLNDPSNADLWTKDNGPTYSWTPIGQATPFAGNFVGQGYTISGLYYSGESEKVGLFGQTTIDSDISNFRLKNSYLYTTKQSIGSIAGIGNGDFDTIYSDAIIESTHRYVGGLIGWINAEGTSTLTNCWYNGKMYLSSTSGVFGGLVGYAYALQKVAEIHMTASLFTGEMNISCKPVNTGGFIGNVQKNVTVTLEACVSAGAMKLPTGVTFNTGNDGVGAVFGILNTGATAQASPSIWYNYYLSDAFLCNVHTGTVKSGATQVAIPGRTYAKLMGKEADANINTMFSTYSNYWQVNERYIPTLKSFSDEIPCTNIDLDLKIADLGFEDYGDGTYLLRKEDADKSLYASYEDKVLSKGFVQEVTNSLDNGNVQMATYKKDDLVVTLTHIKQRQFTYATVSETMQLSKHLKEQDTSNAIDGYKTTLYMPELYAYGDSFIVQLKNGHFIICDGGQSKDAPYLVDFLMEHKPASQEKPVVEAWFITHGHNDHMSVIKEFGQKTINNEDVVNTENPYAEGYADKIIVEGVYFSEPSAECIAQQENKYIQPSIAAFKRGVEVLRDSNGNQTQIYRPQTGQRYYFHDITIDILHTQEQLLIEEYAQNSKGLDLNDSSTWLLFTIEGQKFLVAGDAATGSIDVTLSTYSQDMFALDVLATPHHGQNIYDNFVDVVTCDTVLYSTFVTESQLSSVHQKTQNDKLKAKTRNNGTDYYSWGQGMIQVEFENGDRTISKFDKKTDADWKYFSGRTEPYQGME